MSRATSFGDDSNPDAHLVWSGQEKPPKLKPCPCCGASAERSSRFDVNCVGCGLTINSMSPERDWNTRADIAPAGERIAELPSFEDCEAAVKLGTATPLQRFIYEHEPAGNEAEAQFREGLLALLEPKGTKA